MSKSKITGSVLMGAIGIGLAGCATVLSDQKVKENASAVTGVEITSIG